MFGKRKRPPTEPPETVAPEPEPLPEPDGPELTPWSEPVVAATAPEPAVIIENVDLVREGARIEIRADVLSSECRSQIAKLLQDAERSILQGHDLGLAEYRKLRRSIEALLP